jgi:hypothetical protein
MSTRATKMMIAAPADTARRREESNGTLGVLVGPVVDVDPVVVSVPLVVSVVSVVLVVLVVSVVVVDVVVVVVVGISVSLSGLPR